MTKRILLVDDHALIVDTLLPILRDAWDFEVHREKDLQGALQLIASAEPFDLILLDYQLPDVDGLVGLQTLISVNKGPVALFSGVAGRATVRRAIELGARGWIPKSLKIGVFRGALDLIMVGEIFLPSSFLLGADEEVNRNFNLKDRELNVLELLCTGMPNKEIANKLGLDETLVKLDVKSICTKLGVTNRTQAVIVAQRAGLI